MATVLVSGCFDTWHAGHVEFLRQAAQYGEVHVALGSDATIAELKGRPPLFCEAERKFIVSSCEYVAGVTVSAGSGRMDFAAELEHFRPDFFVVNKDGDSAEKRALCERLGVTYVCLARQPAAGLPARASNKIRAYVGIPYRMDLAGGWLDQPWVSQSHAGPVVVASIWPDHDFAERSGMATSTRQTAKRLWGSALPPGDAVETARILFACENPPGTSTISGSQDALGVCLPGLSLLGYRGEYWPETIQNDRDEETCRWLEQRLRLVALSPREGGYSPIERRYVAEGPAACLAGAAHRVWRAIQEQDTKLLGWSVLAGFQAQLGMFPDMADAEILADMARYRNDAHGWKLTGAGGGGYVLLVVEPGHDDIGLPVRIRR